MPAIVLVPEDDKKVIIDFYVQNVTAEKRKLSPEGFVDTIGGKIYSEWMHNNWYGSRRDYNAEAFTKFINDETYYELQRQGTLGTNREDWQGTRIEMLRRLTLRGIKRADNMYTDNLRASLADVA